MSLDIQLQSVATAQVVVVVIDSMSGAFVGVDSIPSASERFARQVLNRCGMTGILVLLSVGDRYVSFVLRCISM